MEAEAEPDAQAATSETLWDDLASFTLSDRSRALGDDAAERFAWGLERLLDGLLAAATAGTSASASVSVR